MPPSPGRPIPDHHLGARLLRAGCRRQQTGRRASTGRCAEEKAVCRLHGQHDSATDKFFHVQVGPFNDLKDAEATRAKLMSDGYNPILKR